MLQAWQEMQQHLTKGKAEAKDVCQHVTDLHQAALGFSSCVCCALVCMCVCVCVGVRLWASFFVFLGHGSSWHWRTVWRRSLASSSAFFFFFGEALQEVHQQTKQSKADTLGLRERIQDLQQDMELTPC